MKTSCRGIGLLAFEMQAEAAAGEGSWKKLTDLDEAVAAIPIGLKVFHCASNFFL